MRDFRLDRENTREEENKVTFNLTYFPVFQNVKKILAELHLLHLLLTPNVADKAVFTNMPIIGFKNDSSLKDHLVSQYSDRIKRLFLSRLQIYNYTTI